MRKAHQPEDAPQAGRVFYGNEAFYQFYRLHQHMYERCGTALRFHNFTLQTLRRGWIAERRLLVVRRASSVLISSNGLRHMHAG